MNITMLSMQEDQEVQAAELVAEINNGRFQYEILGYSGDISDGIDCADDAKRSSMVLESIRSFLAQEKEIIPPLAIEALKISIEHMVTRLGYSKSFKTLSLESYSQNPKENLKVAIEGLRNIILTILNAIKTAIGKIINWIKEFFVSSDKNDVVIEKKLQVIELSIKPKIGDPKYAKVETNITAEVNRIMELMKNKEDMSGGEVLKTLVSSTHPMIRFENKTLITNPDHLLQQTYKILEQSWSKNLSGASFQWVDKFLDRLLSALKSNDQDQIHAVIEDNDFSQIFNELSPGLARSNVQFKLREKVTRKESGTLLSDSCVYYTEPSDDPVLKDDHDISCGIDKQNKYKDIDSSGKLHLLNLKQCLDLKDIVEKNRSIDDPYKVFPKYQALIENLSKKLDEIDVDELKENQGASSVVNVLRNVISMVTKSKIKFAVEAVAFHQKLDIAIISYISHCEKCNDFLSSIPDTIQI